jgi:predicted RNA-binding protein YlqC (UPF0109 family)
MSTIDQQFVEYIIKSVVGNPDAVQVTRTVDERGVLLELTVDPADLGRVIGKRGSGAQALRTLLRALGTKNEARYNLKIVDNGEDNRGENRDYSSNSQNSRVDTQNSNTDNEKSAENDENKNSEEVGSKTEQTRKELADLDDLDI